MKQRRRAEVATFSATAEGSGLPDSRNQLVQNRLRTHLLSQVRIDRLLIFSVKLDLSLDQRRSFACDVWQVTWEIWKSRTKHSSFAGFVLTDFAKAIPSRNPPNIPLFSAQVGSFLRIVCVRLSRELSILPNDDIALKGNPACQSFVGWGSVFDSCSTSCDPCFEVTPIAGKRFQNDCDPQGTQDVRVTRV